MTNRIVADELHGDISVIDDGSSICVSRQHKDKINWNPKPGVPSPYSEFVRMPAVSTDEEIKLVIWAYEKGHECGWRDGEYALQRKLRDILGIREGF